MKGIIFGLLLSGSVFAQVDEVLALRQEVEALATQVESTQKENQAKLDVYLQRRQELEAQLLRERFRAQQFGEQRRRLADKLRALNLDPQGSLKAPAWFTPLVQELRAELRSGLPLAEESDELAKLLGLMAQGKTTLETGLIQVWFQLEAALKKRQGAEYLMTVIERAGKSVPAELVRLGDLMAFVRTASGEYGLYRRTPQGWQWQDLKDTAEQTQVDKLLSQFKQNQKSGLYQLPGLAAAMTQLEGVRP